MPVSPLYRELRDVCDAIHRLLQLSEQGDAVIAQSGIFGHDHHRVEEIVHRLGALHAVRVAPPASAQALQEKQLTANEVGRSLDAAYVIDGSVRRSASTLRITTRLTRTDDGYVVWSDTYEQSGSDELKTQSEVAERAAAAVREVIGSQ